MQRKKLNFKKGFHVRLGNKSAQAAEMVLKPGDKEGDSKNKHIGSDQWLFVVSGNGIATINNRKYKLSPGTLVLIEKGDTHEILNTGHDLLRTLNHYVPPAYTKHGDPLPRGRRR